LINAILRETPAKPSALNSAVPGHLERIILTALEKERETRYQTAEELLGDLSTLQRAKHRRAVWISRLAIAGGVLAISAAVAIGIVSKRFASEAPNIIQAQVTSNPANDSVYDAAISGDGKELAYTDLRGVHIRALDSGKVYDIPIPPGLCFR
jgi:hypothetical protein